MSAETNGKDAPTAILIANSRAEDRPSFKAPAHQFMGDVWVDLAHAERLAAE